MKKNHLLVVIGALFLALSIASYGCSKKAVKEEEGMGTAAKKEEAKKTEPAIERPVQKEEPMVEAKAEKTAKPEAKDELSALVEKEGKLFPVYFDFDKFFIRDDMKPVLEKDAEWLKKNPAIKIKIEGHCDERGSDEYNLALGDRRANSAKKYLANLGIDSNRISIISYGEEKPACKEANESCWSKNRRAEFVIVK